MAHRIRSLADIPRQKLQELQARPEYKRLWMVPNILVMAFLMITVGFLVVIALGVIPAPDYEEPSPIWPVFLVLSGVEVAVLAMLVKTLLKRMAKARTAQGVMARGFTPMVLAFALSESICIYAMVGSAMGMPVVAQYGLWGFGLLVLIGSHVWVRGQVRAAMLLAMVRESNAS